MAALKIFVNGLAWSTSNDDLKTYFQTWGKVTEAIVLNDSITKASRGMGLVSFENAEDVDKILNANQSFIIDGRTVDVKRAPSEAGSTALPTPLKSACTIFVNGLDGSTTEPDLINYFLQYGEVSEVKLPKDKATERNRGFAFVTFYSEASVDEACKAGQHPIRNKQCGVRKIS